METKLTETQIVTKKTQLEEVEHVARSELEWAESSAFYQVGVSISKIIKMQRDKDAALQKKLEEEALRAQRTIERRTRALESEEQKKRLVVLQTEELQLEALLRILEKEIQGDVFEAAYDAAQRMKYFNKTIDIIIKNESAGRRDILGSERYEYLVLRQQADGAITEQARVEVLQKLQEHKHRVHDDYRAQVTKQQSTRRAVTNSNQSSRAQTVEGAKRRSRVVSRDRSRDASKTGSPTREVDDDSTVTNEDSTINDSSVSTKEAEKTESDEDQKAVDADASEPQEEEEKEDSTKQQGHSPIPEAKEDDAASNSGGTSPNRISLQDRSAQHAENSRIANQHLPPPPPAYFEKQLNIVENRQLVVREAIEADEEKKWIIIGQKFRKADFNKTNTTLLDETARDAQIQFHARQRETIQKDEAVDRDKILKEEIAGWTGIIRRQNRDAISQFRHEESEASRQAAHERKMADRMERIAHQKETFMRRERESQLMEGANEDASEKMQPVFLPQPPQTMLASSTSSSNKSSKPIQNGNGRVRDTTMRMLNNMQNAQRMAIEKDERLEFFALQTQAREQDGKKSYAAKSSDASHRRTHLQVTHAKKVHKRIEYEEERFEAVAVQKKLSKIQVDLTKLQRAEGNARTEMNAEYGSEYSSWDKFSRYLHKLTVASSLLEEAESNARNDIIVTEKRLMDSIKSSEHFHKPVPPPQPKKPLPPPPLKFDDQKRMLRKHTAHRPQKVAPSNEWDAKKPKTKARTTVIRLQTIEAPNATQQRAAQLFYETAKYVPPKAQPHISMSIRVNTGPHKDPKVAKEEEEQAEDDIDPETGRKKRSKKPPVPSRKVEKTTAAKSPKQSPPPSREKKSSKPATPQTTKKSGTTSKTKDDAAAAESSEKKQKKTSAEEAAKTEEDGKGESPRPASSSESMASMSDSRQDHDSDAGADSRSKYDTDEDSRSAYNSDSSAAYRSDSSYDSRSAYDSNSSYQSSTEDQPSDANTDNSKGSPKRKYSKRKGQRRTAGGGGGGSRSGSATPDDRETSPFRTPAETPAKEQEESSRPVSKEAPRKPDLDDPAKDGDDEAVPSGGSRPQSKGSAGAAASEKSNSRPQSEHSNRPSSQPAASPTQGESTQNSAAPSAASSKPASPPSSRPQSQGNAITTQEEDDASSSQKDAEDQGDPDATAAAAASPSHNDGEDDAQNTSDVQPEYTEDFEDDA